MKKLFVVGFAVITLMVIAPTKVHAAYSSGAALGGGFDVGFGSGHSIYFGNLHLAGKFANLPIMFGIDLNIFDAYNYYSGTGFALSGDWWFFNPTFGKLGAATVSFYAGIGGELSFSFGEPFVFGLSARLPLGLSWRIGELEIFTEFLTTLHAFTWGVLSTKDADGNNYGYIRLFGATVAGEYYDTSYYWTKTIDFKPVFGLRYWF